MTHATRIPPHDLRVVVTHSALAGLCPLIPLPYVDDLLIRRITRRMCKTLFAAHDRTLTRPGAAALTTGPSGWLRGAATSVALFPIKKLVRKAVVVLAIKDCGDVASAVFHDGWLLAHLLAHRETPTDPAYLRRVREQMLRTYEDIDPAPLRRALTGAYRAAKVGTLAAVTRLRGGEPDHPDEALISRMRAAAMSQWRYLDRLTRRFHEHLDAPDVRPRAAAAGDSSRAS
jgi:uncharacterized protein (DUF697 family)